MTSSRKGRPAVSSPTRSAPARAAVKPVATACRVDECEQPQWIGSVCREHFAEGHAP